MRSGVASALHVRGPYFLRGAVVARVRRGRERREYKQLEPVVMKKLQRELVDLERRVVIRR